MAIQINTIHVGEAIERRMKELGMTSQDFAKKHNIPAVNVRRDILSKKSLDTLKLASISIILDHNFFEDFCPDRKSGSESPSLENKEGYMQMPVSYFDSLQRELSDLREENFQLKSQISDMQNGMTLGEIAQKKTSDIR